MELYLKRGKFTLAALVLSVGLGAIGFSGCDGSRNNPFGADQVVTDKNGNDRLLLRWKTEPLPGGGLRADFQSLAWQTNSPDGWLDRIVITRDEFQGSGDRRRWVDELHSLNSISGTAIIKVAEGNASTNANSISYEYSWREWNLISNSQVSLIRRCEDSHEEF